MWCVLYLVYGLVCGLFMSSYVVGMRDASCVILCAYVCVYTCVYVCTYVRVYTCMCIHIRAHTCTSVCVYVYVYTCVVGRMAMVVGMCT